MATQNTTRRWEPVRSIPTEVGPNPWVFFKSWNQIPQKSVDQKRPEPLVASRMRPNEGQPERRGLGVREESRAAPEKPPSEVISRSQNHLETLSSLFFGCILSGGSYRKRNSPWGMRRVFPTPSLLIILRNGSELLL